MEFLQNFIYGILHFHSAAALLNSEYNASIALILFLVIFAETGLVFMPFLPGDSLLFTVGSWSALTFSNKHGIVLLLSGAAFLGNIVNYSIGRWLGLRLFSNPQATLFKPSHLIQARYFYEKYGSSAIVIARFIPIIRTFVPFVAGLGQMTYARFIFFSAVGALLWVSLFIYGGYGLGRLPWVQAHFGEWIIMIIFITLIPFFFQLSKNLINRLAKCFK